MASQRQVIEVENDAPRRFVFVLMDQFTLLSFAAAVESLRIANRMAGQDALRMADRRRRRRHDHRLGRDRVQA